MTTCILSCRCKISAKCVVGPRRLFPLIHFSHHRTPRPGWVIISSTCMQYHYIQGHHQTFLHRRQSPSNADNRPKLKSSAKTELPRANVLEPVGSAILFLQPWLAGVELAGRAASALGRVGAVEVGDVVVANVAEPGELSAFTVVVALT